MMSRMQTWETLSLQNPAQYQWHGAATSAPAGIHTNGFSRQRLGHGVKAALSVLASAHARVTR